MHSDVASRSGGSSKLGDGSSSGRAVAASIGEAKALRRVKRDCGSAVVTTYSHFGSAGHVKAAEGQRTESGHSSGMIPMPPLSWETGREEQRPAPKDRLSADADMAYGAGTSREVTKPSERKVMRDSLHTRDGQFQGLTQVISRKSSPNVAKFPPLLSPTMAGYGTGIWDGQRMTVAPWITCWRG